MLRPRGCLAGGVVREHRSPRIVAPDHVIHGLPRGQRPNAGSVLLVRYSLQIEIDLTVGKIGCQNFCDLERERGLADPAHTANSKNASPFPDSLDQLIDISLAAGEIRRRWSKLMRYALL